MDNEIPNRHTDLGEFWGRCAAFAARNAFEKAERWKPVVGVGGLWLLLSLMGQAATLPQLIGGQLVFEGATFAVAVVLVFLVYLIRAPAHLYDDVARKLKRHERDKLVLGRSDISIGLAEHYDLVWEEGNSLGPIEKVFNIIAYNGGHSNLTNCQLHAAVRPLTLRDSPFVPTISSPMFELRPDEKLPLPLISVLFEHVSAGANLVSYYNDGARWKRAKNAPPIHPGEYDVRVEILSADTASATAYFKLIHQGEYWDIVSDTISTSQWLTPNMIKPAKA